MCMYGLTSAFIGFVWFGPYMMGCHHMDFVLGSWAMFVWGLVFLGFNILWVGLRFFLIKINGF